MLGNTPTIKAELSKEGNITAKLTPRATLKAELTVPQEQILPPYTGAYEITPSEETQVLNTAGLKTVNNITVNPIPSNYGLITWDGSTLTVS